MNKVRIFKVLSVLVNGPRRGLGLLVVIYQYVTDYRPSPCRYVPSCSYYAAEAIEVHGAIKGSWLTVCRLLRCRPRGPSGWDPVPDKCGNKAFNPVIEEVSSNV
ncbi:MAG: membrane protein insertion efficiency factor YidD [Acidimicrobiia bacterium]|nr:membrane protein insertion efficiency factor YidD [Acidimicrobiia bacterium]MYC57558.1 membrane protein insertion efficiency factor YidD [Acidimicrobiia bacterium]MYG94849.1 membrane protein insertion efficiency factor YidD [Acidimicrobiia bacterium]MYI30078.1 membrane protein insertion efficiency factor YidD [Acidimicrobiia bacterium]